MLYRLVRDSLPSCSEGSQGLSVPPRVRGICTPTPFSLSPQLRQCESRYAFRAGRNLPDKEFRYLRTVIVTAAVYWGFGLELHPPYGELTPPLNLPAPGRPQPLYITLMVLQRPVFLINSRPRQFSATLLSFRSEFPHPYTYRGHAFFRSYGVNLPSSLTGVLSSALAFSAHLPVSVCGTGTRSARYEDFLGSVGSANPLFPKKQGPITSRS